MPSSAGTANKWTRGASDAGRRIKRIRERPKRAKGDDPSPEYLRECIRDGFCPWCDIGGWQVLSLHTWHAHGISANEIRDIAGLYLHDPTCVAEHSGARRANLIEQMANGRPPLPVGGAAGKKKKYSKAGRIFLETVQTARVRSTPIEQRRRAAAIAQKARLKPHNCPACGVLLPTAYPITCSPECRKTIRQRTARKTMAGRVYPEETLARFRLAAKARNAKYGNNNPPKPHPCPICGKTIPRATPRTCSRECLSEALRRAQVKGLAAKGLKIPLSEWPTIQASNKPSRILATEYGVSREWIDQIKRTPSERRKVDATY